MVETTETYPRIRALLVDDKTFARDVGQRILKSVGLTEIQEAPSGRMALELLRQENHSIDVVFCDLMMPDMDGVEFVRHVSALPVKPAFAFVSGADQALLNTVASAAKARDILILGTIKKPLTAAAVRHILAQFDHAPPLSSRGQTSAPITASDLEAGMADDQFLMYFQPKVSLATGALDGVESLARWQHPVHGMISPSVFIGVAEKNGLIGALTERTMALSLQQSEAWAVAGLQTKVSVNLSAYMLVDVKLPDRLASAVARAGLDPKQVILEITESGLFQDAADTLDILARLHMKGFSLSIDDFGTGYSSMEQLSRVPFAELKIDGAFVRGIAENERARSILESSVDLARRLGLTVVAEGAETQEDWDVLREVGVDLVQGYFVAKPMPAEDIQPWASAWEDRKKAILT